MIVLPRQIDPALPDPAAPTHRSACPPPRSQFDMTAMPQVTRARQIAATLAHAHDDAGFRDAAAQGDVARDRGDWAGAQANYGAALARFPLHWGYAIQYAHVVKEQSYHALAEAWYRSAVALGAPPDMVDQHLNFVARLNGADFQRRGMPALDVPPLHAPPTLHDIRLIVELARVPGLSGPGFALDLLRHAPDNRAVLMRIMAAPDFARTNRAFLAIVGDGHG